MHKFFCLTSKSALWDTLSYFMRKTLQQLFQEFMYESEFVKKARPETLLGYRYAFRTFNKLLPECSLETLLPSEIVRFFKILQERKRVVGKGIIKVGIKR